MPAIFRTRLQRAINPKKLEDRAFQASERYYRDKGLGEDLPTEQAQQDQQVGQLLSKKKRGLSSVKLSGMEN